MGFLYPVHKSFRLFLLCSRTHGAFADRREGQGQLCNGASVLVHVVLPIMYTADWILFYQKGMVRLSYPFLSMLLPLAYLLYVFVHAAVHHFDMSIMKHQKVFNFK